MNKPPIRLPAGLPALHPLRFAWTGLALLTALLAVWGLALLRPAPAQAEASATALISISFYTTYDPAASTTIYEDRLAWGKVSLSDQAGGNQDPTGSVQLTAAEIGLNCTITYTNGSDGEGECAFIPSQSGTFTVTAAYSGDSKFNPASKQISQTISAFANSPTRLSAGRSQTCLLKPDQTLRCWGEPMTIPIDASGAPRTVSGYVAVSAGSYHTCAIRAADGGIDCWGDDGTITNTVPTGQFSAISSGEQHVCALDANHAVKCWGHLDDGLTAAHSGAYRWISAGDKNDCAIDLDDSTTECWGSSANINSYHGVLRELAVGNNHACGIKNDGALHCWGALSNSDTSSVFSEIDSGSGYSCAHDSQDRLKCWGGATTPLVNPRLVYPEFSAGFLHVCALRSKTGGYYLACWANPDNKFYDQAPRLSLAPTSIAAYLPRDRYWSQALTPSGGHPNYTLAHTAGTLPPGISLSGAGVLTGTLAGTPTVANSYAFTVTTSENFRGSALPLELEPRAAAYTTIIQDPSTSVSIGLNPTSAAAGIPVKITVNVSKTGAPALGGSVTITSTEAEVGCSVAVSGSSAECTVSFSTAGAVTVYATYQGDDFYTRSPRGSAAITISAPSFTPALAAGKAFNLSLALDGKLFGWGKDDSGQASPDPTIAYSTVTAGEAHACARKLNGRAACWGWNGYGQAGPPSGTSFALLSAGRLHTCGVQQDGRLACWGSAAGNRLAAPADLIAIRSEERRV
ncbi:MAG: Ig-like domain repeat protein, partial [Chloroflexota bacterium]